MNIKYFNIDSRRNCKDYLHCKSNNKIFIAEHPISKERVNSLLKGSGLLKPYSDVAYCVGKGEVSDNNRRELIRNSNIYIPPELLQQNAERRKITKLETKNDLDLIRNENKKEERINNQIKVCHCWSIVDLRNLHTNGHKKRQVRKEERFYSSIELIKKLEDLHCSKVDRVFLSTDDAMKRKTFISKVRYQCVLITDLSPNLEDLDEWKDVFRNIDKYIAWSDEHMSSGEIISLTSVSQPPPIALIRSKKDADALVKIIGDINIGRQSWRVFEYGDTDGVVCQYDVLEKKYSDSSKTKIFLATDDKDSLRKIIKNIWMIDGNYLILTQEPPVLLNTEERRKVLGHIDIYIALACDDDSIVCASDNIKELLKKGKRIVSLSNDDLIDGKKLGDFLQGENTFEKERTINKDQLPSVFLATDNEVLRKKLIDDFKGTGKDFCFVYDKLPLSTNSGRQKLLKEAKINIYVFPITSKYTYDNKLGSEAEKHNTAVANEVYNSDIDYLKNNFREKAQDKSNHLVKIIPILDSDIRKEDKETIRSHLEAKPIGKCEYLDSSFHFGDMDYKKRLRKCLDVIGDSDEIDRIRGAFPCYLFLSYRSKDRVLAKELIKEINTGVSDAAIWYDRLLVAGRDFSEQINNAIDNCDLFLLLTNNNMLEKSRKVADGENRWGNYVSLEEYPYARAKDKIVQPFVKGKFTKKKEFSDLFPKTEELLYEKEKLLERIKRTIKENKKSIDESSKNLWQGKAYLTGTLVPMDFDLAKDLFFKTVEEGHGTQPEILEAYDLLIDSYANATVYQGKSIEDTIKSVKEDLSRIEELAEKKITDEDIKNELSDCRKEIEGTTYENYYEIKKLIKKRVKETEEKLDGRIHSSMKLDQLNKTAATNLALVKLGVMLKGIESETIKITKGLDAKIKEGFKEKTKEIQEKIVKEIKEGREERFDGIFKFDEEKPQYYKSIDKFAEAFIEVYKLSYYFLQDNDFGDYKECLEKVILSKGAYWCLKKIGCFRLM